MAAPTTPAGTRAVVVVPARLESTRLARKMLRRDTGRYLFQHTVEAARAAGVGPVWLATDSDEILRAAAEVGVDALATSPRHPSGTDRVHEAARLLEQRGLGPFDVIVNVQGDEPELPPEALRALVRLFADPAVSLATLAAPLQDAAELHDPDTVKVVCDADGWALYFSRAAIGAARGPAEVGPTLRHVGVYAFRPDALERFRALPPGRLETAERLEQLRWLEAGGRVRVARLERAPRDVNNEAQYAAFAARWAARSPVARSSSPSP